MSTEPQNNPPQVLIAGRNVSGNWETVLLINGQFDRTFSGTSLSDVLSRAMTAFTSVTYPDDTRIQVSLSVSDPEQK